MNSIAFVLATRELFVTGRSSSASLSSVEPSGPGALADAEVQPIAEPRLIRELRRLGWPAEARLVDPHEAGSGEPVPGVLVELLDALPVLAAPTEEEDEGPELVAFRQAARLALDLMIAGAALPRVRARSGGRLGWEARWRSLPVTAAQRAKVVRIGELLPALTAVPAGPAVMTWKLQGAVPLNGQRLLYRLLDACADMLVREASRRGALVRLGSWPATAWEQQLVRALGEDRATFRCPDPTAAELCAKDVNDWVQDQLKAAALALLPSPAGWTAPETLAQVLARLLTPAAQLAQTLRSGRPAPRMLPTATWLPEKTGAAPRLRQAAA